jgi:hypothetical protein
MRIEKRIFLVSVFCVFGLVLNGKIFGATIEVESDDDSVVPSPTAQASSGEVFSEKKENLSPVGPQRTSPTPTSIPVIGTTKPTETPVATAFAQPTREPTVVKSKESMGKVRISDKVNFFNFVQAGFLAADPSQVNGVGTVVKTEVLENYTVAQKPAIEVTSDNLRVKNGDLFIVYRCEKGISEPHSGFLGYQVEMLALVEVIETQKTRHLVEVKKSFKPFLPGDHVIPYESEVKRWKRVQVKKNLPDHPILAYVAGLDSPRTQYISTDAVLITAGTKNGVVEGQLFQLFKVREGEFEKEDLGLPIGSARVIFCGQMYSIVRIVTCSEAIEPGFQAVYRP